VKNYTSSVPADVTVLRIEKVLVKYGASHIAKGYKDGEVVSLSFSIPMPPEGNPMRVNLPANPAAVAKVLMDGRPPLSPVARKRIEAQARRTAWRLMQDLVEVQLSMVEMEQAEFVQIFLPYIEVGGKTFYESLKAGGFKMLEAPK
jgi:hypothetical protein